ncbi:MAG: hypothetical protein QW831_04985 [Candidatus Jordarchaeaceae archaeon]
MVVVVATVVIRDDRGRTLLVNDNGVWAILTKIKFEKNNRKREIKD